MTSLTEASYYTRRAINWAILGVIAYIILRILWGGFVGLALLLFPPKPPPPNHAFGRLPAIKFPSVASPSAQFTFRLETIEGTVPKASESAIIYFMPKSPPNLLALTRTQSFAERFGFTPNPIPETKNIYRFDDNSLSQRKLRYDIVSNNFIIRYAYEQDMGLFADRNLPTAEAARAEARSLLQTYGLYPEDYAKGTTSVTFLKLSGNGLVPATSQSQANAVRVDFSRTAFHGLPIITPNPGEGAISIIFSPSSDQKKKILQFAYTYWPIDIKTAATYQLKPSSQAWQELQSGLGYIPRYPTKGNTIVVRDVHVSYFDTFEPQTYLQPVFVFEGDDGFIGIVSAVASPWTE